MAEVTHTQPVQFGLKKGAGKGPRLLAMHISIAADADIITLPFKKIHSVQLTKQGATLEGAAITHHVNVISVTGGVIAVSSLAKDGAGNLATVAITAYLTVIGTTKQYAT